MGTLHRSPQKFARAIFCCLFVATLSLATSGLNAQNVTVSRKGFNAKAGVTVKQDKEMVTVTWPAGADGNGRILINLKKGEPLFSSIGLSKGGANSEVIKNVDPQFILTEGKRDLVSQNGWNIFFDKVPLKPHQSYKTTLDKRSFNISSSGTRTVITIGSVTAPNFSGDLQITLYTGQPLFNVAAVISTDVDSTAIVYDAGLVANKKPVSKVSWSDVYGKVQSDNTAAADTATNLAVKYRTVLGSNAGGSIAVFPAPHQYFYPLDEAFNLKFVWYGNNYRKTLDGFGIGIRQELKGDNRFVPWFNAPPGTKQRLNFFCLLGKGDAGALLENVKRFTHNDVYKALPGYKTMASHFHNEFIMNVVMAGKPVPEKPAFVDVFKKMNVNIVHLGEFHYTAHPKGPEDKRLAELKALFDQCKRLSTNDFLLLPGEEPNEFYGGHWLQIFPKPVYWIMSREAGKPFVTEDAEHGKVYHIGDKNDMLQLLKTEKGLAWTAHPRTKGSTGYPDKYKDEDFFKSPTFMGGAWKAMPADLSQPHLGKRVLDLMDDMNNWGLKKTVISEADLFTITPENEMYAHMNINYLRMNKQPQFNAGWQPVVDAMQQGNFFSTTGEVLINDFTVDGKQSGTTVTLPANGTAKVSFKLDWTFPMQYADVISGDGEKVYHKRINLDATKAFGTQTFTTSLNLKGRTWVRLEVWDAAVNGAFTQTVWLK